jgi:hypothetical protein
MTINYPTKVYTQKLNHIRSIPAVASITAPKLSEWTAGIAAQCSFEADQFQYALSAASGTSQRYCDAYETTTPGRKKLESFDMEVYVDPQLPTDVNHALATAWKLEPSVFIALRPGIADTTAGAVGQILSPIFPAKIQSLGLLPPKPSDANDSYRWLFKVLPTGDPSWDVAIVTG